VKSGQEVNQYGALPLLVKLEGGMIATDVVWESFFLMLGRNPLLTLMLPVWLKDGPGRVSAELLQRFPPEAPLLPYHQPLFAYLETQRKAGRRLVLATAMPLWLGRQVADHLGIFDRVVSINDNEPSAGHDEGSKVLVDQPGSGFVFAGQSLEDPVAKNADAIVLVETEKGGTSVQNSPKSIEKRIVVESANWRACLRAARVHQWLKNLLVFVPLVTSHQIGDMNLVVRALCAFLSFSLCASAIYLLNDLVDLSADRKHRIKRNRPLASGLLSIKWATLAIPVLIVSAFTLGLYPGFWFLLILSAYIALTTLYSCWLKKLVIADVVTLALLYTLRLLAGGAAVAIMPSFWLLSFSMFIFFSLALMKRSADLVLGMTKAQDLMEGRGYVDGDAAIVQMSGIASGYMSVLVLALYINSDEVRLLYAHPEVIWVLCPLFFYWISRVWLITGRGGMSVDPVLFALRDRVSQAVAFATAIILWFAA